MLLRLVLYLFLISGLAAESRATFRVWHYESAALAASWDQALALFQRAHPDVRIELRVKTFDEVQETSAQTVDFGDPPDVLEVNKGNAYAGAFAARGLLTDLTAEAQRRGWARFLPGSLPGTERYDDRGVMGSGRWYGMPSYGEIVLVCYNKDLFRKYGQKLPASLADLDASLGVFQKAGVVPLVVGALDYPAQHLLYELYLSQATRAEVNSYQFGRGPGNLQGSAWQFAARTFSRWARAGYLGTRALTLDDDHQRTEFEAGRAAVLVMGSWDYPKLLQSAPGFDWEVALFPGNSLHPGSAGNLWVVPRKARHPDWALEFIDLTLRSDVQTLLAEQGGIPLNVDLGRLPPSRAVDPLKAFRKVAADDGLAYYPDWPAQGFYDSLISGTQDLLRGADPDRVLEGLSLAYGTKKASP